MFHLWVHLRQVVIFFVEWCVRVALDRHMAGAMAVTIDLTFFMATKQTGWWQQNKLVGGLEHGFYDFPIILGMS